MTGTANLGLTPLTSGQLQPEVTVNFDLELLDGVLAPAAAFGNNPNTTAGLTYGYYGANLSTGTVVGGTIALTASATNYVQRTAAGVVSVNTTGFTEIPMATVLTGASTISSITDERQPDAFGLSNPMTSLGDMIMGLGGGSASRLPIGAQGQVLSVTSGASGLVPAWTNATSGGTSTTAGGNRIINGNFQINQRAYVSGTALTSGTYAHDRWKAGSGGCTYTFTQAANGQQITITAGSLEQVIEDANIEGGTYTLSWTGTASGSVNGGAAAASPITVTGLAASTAATVSFGTGTVGAVQFEPGPTATPFEQLPIDKVLTSCQRYFYSTYNAGIAPGSTNQDATSISIWCVSASSGAYYMTAIGLPAPMRAAPSFVVYSAHTGATGKAYMHNAAADQPANIFTAGEGTVTPALINATVLAGDTAKLHFTLSAEL